MSVLSKATRDRWRKANRARTSKAIDVPRSAIAPEFVMDRFARANRDQIEERKIRMRALKMKWRGEIPLYILKDFDS